MESKSSNYSTRLNSTFSTSLRFRSPSRRLEWEKIAYEEWTKFQHLHDQCISIFDKFETTLLVLGVFGNLLAFITLLRGRHMRTPSFVYHKALVLAYLIYCLNFLIVKCVNITLTVPSKRRQLVYYNPLAAYYAVILNRVITSVCGYLALYTSLAISVDRFVALVLFKSYAKFNKHFVAYCWVGISLVLSLGVHSWAPWVENDIQSIPVKYDQNEGYENLTVLAYRHEDSAGLGQLKPYLVAKDWYNLMVRFAYAILLTMLTSTVIYTFAQQQKKRSTLCHVSKRQLRRERSLFYLMIAVVIMAYIQVIPRESKRILELTYPQDYVARKVEDDTLSIGVRRLYLLFGLYGFTFTTPILNLCTIIERSLLFYLYFALNHTFRREVLNLLHLRSICHKLSIRLGFSSDQENERRASEFELPSRNDLSARRYRSGSSQSIVGKKPRADSETTVNAAEYGRFLTPIAPDRQNSPHGSFQTTHTEYSSLV